MILSFAGLLDPQAHSVVLASALAFMGLEACLSRLTHHDTHDVRESAASLGIALGQSLVRSLEAIVVAVPYSLAYQHRLLTFDQTSPWALLGLFLGSEFLYYVHHRASHRIRWLWATHSVHHSAMKLNLTAAVRLGWTGNISGNFLFFLPLAWVGFHPYAIVAMLGVNLLYQFFIHTELVPRLGPLEWVLNTPAHHRVHHASNAACLDKNYGGILIVFDRLFGTFYEAPRDVSLRYGLAGGTRTYNPLRIAFGEWLSIYRDFKAAPSWSDRLLTVFGPPGAPKPKEGPAIRRVPPLGERARRRPF